MSHDHDHCNQALSRRLQRAASEGCEESRLLMSRRAMLGVTASLFSWACMPRWAEAATDDPRLLVVVLRGGMDGLSIIPPRNDPNYRSARPQIAVPDAAMLATPNERRFGLHPSLAPLHPLWLAGQMAVVHAVASPDASRRSTEDEGPAATNGIRAARAARASP